MENNIINKFELHEKWIETLGNEGKKLTLQKVDLRNIDLANKLFDQALIVSCVFDSLTLENIDFHTSVLCSTSYKNAKLYNCNFYRTDLGYADFTSAIIKGVNFSKSDFCDTVFCNADLFECKLINGCFYLTDFSNAILNNVDISGATFDEALLNGVILKNILGIEEAHFKSINIGTIEEPIILEGAKAKEWVIANCSYNSSVN